MLSCYCIALSSYSPQTQFTCFLPPTSKRLHASISPQATCFLRNILLLLPPTLASELRRVRIPPAEADLDVVALREVGNAPEVARQVAPEYRSARRLRLAHAHLLIPRAVQQLILGEEQISFVLVALGDEDERREGA